MKAIINYLRSEASVFVAIACVMLVQMTHNTYVVYTNSHFELTYLRFAFAFFYAFAIEFSILIYVINDMDKHAIGYSIASLAMNLFYYYAPPAGDGSPSDQSFHLAPLLISSMLAFSIWSFSELFKKKINTERKEKEAREEKSAAKPFQCDLCEESFDTSRQLNGHRSAHLRVMNKELKLTETEQTV